MKKILRRRLSHALPAFLLAAGLVLPLLGVLDPSFVDPRHLLPVLLVVLLFEVAAVNRLTAVLGLSLSVAGLLFWLLANDGITALRDLLLGLSLRLSGQTAALPLIAPTVIGATVILLSLLACFCMLDRATWLPSLCLTVAVALLAFLSDRMQLLPWLLPACAAVLLRMMLDRYEGQDPLRLLPWSALLVASAFLLVPKNTADLAILKDQVSDLRQSVMDRLFFTEARDVFSLSAEGYYPQGSHQLGGKPEISDHAVMQVSAPRRTYLRGVIFNEYNGRAWSNTTGGRRYLWQSITQRENRDRIFNAALPPESVRNSLCDTQTVSVRMLSDSASTLFLPQRIRELLPGGSLVPYFSNASEVFVTRNLEAGATWSVQAPLFVAGDSGLGRIVEACAAFPDADFDRVVKTYTQLPAHLEQPVYDLALSAASAGATPYEQALAIQTFLSRGFRYTLEVDRQPENQDFVTRFLLETKEGYCTYFASAMTILCRMVGLPARYVEGYLADPDETGNCLVTGYSAHAWTEVYFSGFGWLTFDATPAHSASDHSENAAPSAVPTQPATATPDPVEEPTEEPASTPAPESVTPEPEWITPSPPPASPAPPEVPPTSRDAGPGSALLWLLLPAAIAALVLRIYFTAPTVRARRAASESDRFEIWAQDLFELLRAENRVRARGETLMAFGSRVDASPRFSVSLSPCVECISLIHYSRVQPLESDTALLRETARTLRRELSAPSRLRYFLRRIFLPRSRRDYAASSASSS